MDIIAEFTFKIAPVAKERARADKRGFHFTPAKTKNFENALKTLFRMQWRQDLIVYAVGLEITFTLVKPKSVKRKRPCVRPDVDNYLKSALDAMNGTVLKDDALACEIRAVKQYGSEGRIDIRVYGLT